MNKNIITKKIRSLDKSYESLKNGYVKIVEDEVKTEGGAKTLSRALGKEHSYVRKCLERTSMKGLRALVAEIAQLRGYV